MAVKDRPTPDRVRQALEYIDGELYWKHRPEEHFSTLWQYEIWNKRFAGKKLSSH